MNELMRTLIYLAVAAGLCTAAVMTREPALVTSAGLELQGQAFFPALTELTDFSQVTDLEVWDFREESAEAVPFKVQLKDGVWVIPSKDNYPADAGDKLGKVAAALANLTRGSLRTDREADHETYGAVDPMADLSKPSAGRGRRITLKDAAEKVLADIVIGKALEGEEGKRFARLPSEKRVWSVALDLELSTKFNDWIETDLLGLEVAEITSITVDAYHVDEEQGRIVPEYELVLGQGDAGEWALAGQSDDEQASMAAVDSMTETLDELTIADVQPFSYDVLQSLGFFMLRDGRTVKSNEGELHVDLRSGVRYTIRFGEVVPSTNPEAGLQRFALVDAMPRYEALPDPEDPDARKQADDTVRRLNKRFAGWYYVISAESFDALRPDRDALVEPKTADEGAGDGAPFGEDFFSGEHGPGDGHGHPPAGGETPQDGGQPQDGDEPADAGTPQDAGAEPPAELFAELDALEAAGKLQEALAKAEAAAAAYPANEQLAGMVLQLRDIVAAQTPTPVEQPAPAGLAPREVLDAIDALEAEGKLEEALARAEQAAADYPADELLPVLIGQLRAQLGGE